MHPFLRYTARAGCAISLLACAPENSPTAVAVDSVEAIALDESGQMTMEPTPEDLEAMPYEFRTAASILSARTDVGFNASDGAWAQGIMDYFATNAAQEVTLIVRSADREVARKVGKGAAENFLPAIRTLRTMVSIPLGAACGHVGDGHTAHRAFHKFLVAGWKFLQWSESEVPSDGMAEQGACQAPPPGSGGSDGGDPYEGECEVCQQWFYYIDGMLAAEWWDCVDADPSLCGFGDRS